jgi:hypothetical protein
MQVHVKDALDFYQEKHRKKYDVIIQGAKKRHPPCSL